MADFDSQRDAGAPKIPVQQPSLLEDEEFYTRAKQNFLRDSAASEEWRDKTKKNFDFVSGDQWEPDSFRRMIRDERRVPVTFNRTASFIKSICGLEINGRHEVVYLPRGTEEGEIVLNEDLTQASKWMASQCDAEDHESLAFYDVNVCGMGWTESRLDFERDPDGMYAEEHVDPVEMYWDRTARGKNLLDAQRVYRVRKMRLEDARALADSMGGEDVPDEELDATWAIGVDQKAVKPYEEVRLKTGAGNAAQEGIFAVDPNSEVHVVQMQWWEREPYYRVAHPLTGEEVQLSKDEYAQLQQAAQRPFKAIKQVRKVYKQAFLGGRVIARMDCPCPDRFTFQCMTGELHRSKGTWNGIVDLLRDPQMWTNKLFSQVMHILNTTAKGGILAEKGAFPDIREAQRTFARPDAITIVEDGAITKGRIMQKPGVGLAAPFVSMMEYSMRAMPDVTGINLELLGMRDTNQPGILEAQRKQAGMTILATLFDARAHYLKQIGRIRLHFIQNWLADGRLMRIVGPNGMRAVRLLRDKVAGQYDVEVTDAPTSPDTKNQTWQMLMQLAPFFKDRMTPQIASIFLEYSPLPTKAVDQIKTAMQAPNPEQMQQQAVAKAGAMAKVADLRAATAQKEADTRQTDAMTAKTLAEAVLDMAQAGAAINAQQATQVESMLMQMMQARANAGLPPIQLPPGNGFAVEPQGMGSPHQLPSLPQLPIMGRQNGMPPGLPAGLPPNVQPQVPLQ